MGDKKISILFVLRLIVLMLLWYCVLKLAACSWRWGGGEDYPYWKDFRISQLYPGKCIWDCIWDRSAQANRK